MRLTARPTAGGAHTLMMRFARAEDGIELTSAWAPLVSLTAERLITLSQAEQFAQERIGPR